MDAIKRKELVQKLHTKLVKVAVGIQANIDEFPPAMYTDERMASFGFNLGKLLTAYLLEMLMEMEVPPEILAEKLLELTKE